MINVMGSVWAGREEVKGMKSCLLSSEERIIMNNLVRSPHTGGEPDDMPSGLRGSVISSVQCLIERTWAESLLGLSEVDFSVS